MFPHFNDNRPYLLSVAFPTDLLQSRQPFQLGLVDGFRAGTRSVLDAVVVNQLHDTMPLLWHGLSQERKLQVGENGTTFYF